MKCGVQVTVFCLLIVTTRQLTTCPLTTSLVWLVLLKSTLTTTNASLLSESVTQFYVFMMFFYLTHASRWDVANSSQYYLFAYCALCEASYQHSCDGYSKFLSHVEHSVCVCFYTVKVISSMCRCVSHLFAIFNRVNCI